MTLGAAATAVSPGSDGFRSGPGRSRSGHGHLWSLPDGTGLHAPYGELAREDSSGRPCCHLCGRFFRALGSHVRRHGYTAASYREDMGLGTTTRLVAPDLSARISARQTARYDASADVRAAFAAGQAMARSGELGRRSAGSRAATDRQERVMVRRASLDRGRASLAARRENDRARRLATLGSRSLPEHLRRRHAEGASLEVLRAETGLGRARLREAMDQAGIVRRAPGATTPAGRRSRARAAEAAAAARVGTDDLVRWLVDRRAAGDTVAELARAVGHSAPWVRWRLAAVG